MNPAPPSASVPRHGRRRSPACRERRPATGRGAGSLPARPSPVMEQYIEIKAANPDCLLFYRMGDIYELFFADAETASQALGIVLTKRGKYLGRDIPMCGVPVHRADDYLHRLIALGHRVAVCEQLEDPAEAKKRGSKSVGEARRHPPGDAGHCSPRTRCSTRGATTTCSPSPAHEAPPTPRQIASRWPGSTSRPASSGSPNATVPACPPRSRGWKRPRSWFPMRSTPTRSWRPISERCRRR